MREIEKYVQKISARLKQKHETLCAAESCTGGLFSSALTDFSGAGDFFSGAVVSYTHCVKSKLFQIPRNTLKSKGAVNKETAEFMARGVKSLLHADWAVSITGLMGPGGDGISSQPVGQTFVSVGYKENFNTRAKIISGADRQERKIKAVIFSLDFLLLNLTEKF